MYRDTVTAKKKCQNETRLEYLAIKISSPNEKPASCNRKLKNSKHQYTFVVLFFLVLFSKSEVSGKYLRVVYSEKAKFQDYQKNLTPERHVCGKVRMKREGVGRQKVIR